MSLSLHFELTLSSDYHVGAGRGFGPGVDSALQRDADGVPVLRGSTLRGLLRGALYEMLRTTPLKRAQSCQQSGKVGDGVPSYCGQQDGGEEPCPVCRVFGSPARPKRWRVSSARPAGAPTPVQSRLRPLEGSQVAARARISPRTRRAEGRKLFFREEGAKGLTFHFSVACDAENAEALAEAAWLVAAARWVRHLGAGRRRGPGECALHLLNARATSGGLPALGDGESYEGWFLDHLAQVALGLDRPGHDAAAVSRFLGSPRSCAVPQASGQAGVVRLRALLRLDEPAVLSERSEVGNELHSLEFVPGVALRGALASRAAAARALETDQGAYEAFVQLFFRGLVRPTPLYPARSDGEALYPAIPAPRDLYSCELYPGFAAETSAAHGAEGWAAKAPADLADPGATCCSYDGCDADLTPLSGFWSLDSLPKKAKLPRVSELHVGIQPKTGRADPHVLYSYDALAPGQYLVGEVLCSHENALQELLSLADLSLGRPISLRIGKAVGRGYGGATLWLERAGSPLWCPTPLNQRVTSLEAPLVMTLLSDAIVADPWGRPVRAMEESWLQSELGFPLAMRSSYSASRIVDGFSTKLGLPRWRDIALMAGSSVGLVVGPGLALPALRDRLSRLEEEGIGLRRNEGFGRLVFNHPIYQGCQGMPSAQLSLPEAMRLLDNSMDAAHKEQVFRKYWQKEINAKVGDGACFRDSAFVLLARLFTARPPASAEAWKQQIETLERGDLQGLLPADTWRELEVRGQDTQTYVRKHLQTGLKKLVELAVQLEGSHDGRIYWALGVRMILERVAAGEQKAPPAEQGGGAS